MPKYLNVSAMFRICGENGAISPQKPVFFLDGEIGEFGVKFLPTSNFENIGHGEKVGRKVPLTNRWGERSEVCCASRWLAHMLCCFVLNSSTFVRFV